MSDIDELFSKLLGESNALSTSPRPKKNKTPTYATDYTWRLDCFVAYIYETTCEACGRSELSAGPIFKRSVGRVSQHVVSLVRIPNLSELESHPALPRRVEVKRQPIMACPECLGAMNFIATLLVKEDENGETKTP